MCRLMVQQRGTFKNILSFSCHFEDSKKNVYTKLILSEYPYKVLTLLQRVSGSVNIAKNQ